MRLVPGSRRAGFKTPTATSQGQAWMRSTCECTTFPLGDEALEVGTKAPWRAVQRPPGVYNRFARSAACPALPCSDETIAPVWRVLCSRPPLKFRPPT
jgi:hypothetical protein